MEGVIIMVNMNDFEGLKGKKKKYLAALLEAKAAVLGQMEFHSDEALKYEKDSAGLRAGMATHMADLGSDNYRHDMELQLLTEEGNVNELIDEALQRLKDGDFGKCLECGCPVPHERLMIKPYARYCVSCKKKIERES
jgi:DnaK suppressor protein